MSRLSARSVWNSFLVAILLAAGVLGCAWFYRHRNDGDLRMVGIHVLSDMVPFLAGLAIALWAEHVTKLSHTTRLIILFGGLAWSGVSGWRDYYDIQASKVDIGSAINTAVSNANSHTDQEIGTVTQDVDNKFADLTKNVSSGFSGLKSPPPKYANLKFFFLDAPANSTAEELRAGTDGVFTVNLLARNISDMPAKNADVWIDLCNDCVWAEEPAGFDKPKGTPEFERHGHFGDLNSGVAASEITLKIKVTKKFASFALAGKYSCETCGPIPPSQELMVYILPDLNIKLPTKLN